MSPDSVYCPTFESCRLPSSENRFCGKSSTPAIEMLMSTSAVFLSGSVLDTSPSSARIGPGSTRIRPSSASITVGVPHPSFASGPNT